MLDPKHLIVTRADDPLNDRVLEERVVLHVVAWTKVSRLLLESEVNPEDMLRETECRLKMEIWQQLYGDLLKDVNELESELSKIPFAAGTPYSLERVQSALNTVRQKLIFPD